MIKIILTEGDSWTAGDIIDPAIKEDLKGNVNSELNDNYRLPKVWPHKLGSKLKTEVLNTSVAGSSNDGIVRRVIENTLELIGKYDKDSIQVIIGLTSPERKDFYHKKDNDYGWDVLYPLDSSELTEERKLFKKVYSSIYWNKEEYLSRYLQSVFLIHTFLQAHGVQHFFFNAFYQDNSGDFGFDLHKSIELFKEKSGYPYLKSLGINALIYRYEDLVRHYYCNTSFKGYLDNFATDVYDGLHPNEKGHGIWAEYLYQFIKKRDTNCIHDMYNLTTYHDINEAVSAHYKDMPQLNEIDERGYPMMRPLYSYSDLNRKMEVSPKSFELLKEGENFYYFVQLHHDIILCAQHLRKLPLYVIKGLRNRTCKLILDDSLEGRNISVFLEEIYRKATNMELYLPNIYYITNNLYAEAQHVEFKRNNAIGYKEHLNVISYMYNVMDVNRLKSSTENIIEWGKLPKYVDIQEEIQYKKDNLKEIRSFLKVNRTGRPERNLFMLYVDKHNLYDKINISFPGLNPIEDIDSFASTKFSDLLSKDRVKSLKSKLPFDIDFSDASNHGAPGHQEGMFNADLPFNPVHYKNTFISIVFCAFPFDNACHLHSSTFNPMYCGHPVIQFGPKGHLAELKRRGFKTFSKWWSEDYDNIHDGWMRFEEICKIVHKLYKLTNEDLLEMYIDMKDVLQHNSNLIFNYDYHNKLTNRILYNNDSSIQ